MLSLKNFPSNTSVFSKSRNEQQVANGSNLKDIKARIKSVGSIKKITKTMNMIATARLKQAQQKMEKARGYYATVSKLAENLPAPTDPKKTLIVTIGSDRGLCGAINSSITKIVKPMLREKENRGETVQVVCVGEKIPGQLAREFATRLTHSFTETSKKSMSYLSASLIADRILQNDFDAATLFFNKFNTVISYTTTQQQIASPTVLANKREFFDDFEFEDEETTHHIPDVVEHLTASTIYRSYLEGSAAELGGRMSSMDSATRNAEEMIKKLTISYNRRRQAAITTELTEIIS